MADDKDESEIDTDDLLFSGVETMSNAASLLSDPERKKDSKTQNQSSKQSNLPAKSVRRLNFDDLNIGSELKSLIDFSQTSSTSTSCAVTPSAKSKSCLKKSPSPMKSNAQVSFVPDFDDGRYNFVDSYLITDEKFQTIRNLFSNVRQEFEKLSRISNFANNSFQSSSDSSSYDEAKEEINFVKNLNSQDLQELFQAEIYKRIHGERKIRMLQKQILDLEQRLTVANATNNQRFAILTDLQTRVDDLIVEMTTKDKQRNNYCTDLVEQNSKLKCSVEQLVDFSEALTKKYENLNEDFRRTSSKLTETDQERAKFQSENDTIRRQLAEIEEKSETLIEKIRVLESEKKRATSREEELTKEILSSEKIIKDSAMIVQRLKNDLNVEKNAHRSSIEEMEHSNQSKFVELVQEFEKRQKKIYDECDHRVQLEIRRIKNERDASLKMYDEKYLHVINERDDALKKLKEFERCFEDNLRVMYYSMQQRLTSKYYELVSEFSVPPQRPASAAAAATARPDDKSYNLADEFLDRLQKVELLSTPRHAQIQQGQQSNKAPTNQNPETFQQFSKIFSNKNTNTPSDPSGKL